MLPNETSVSQRQRMRKEGRTIVVTTSESVVLMSPGAVADRGQIVLNAWRGPQASLDAVGEVMIVKRYWSGGSTIRWLNKINWMSRCTCPVMFITHQNSLSCKA